MRGGLRELCSYRTRRLLPDTLYRNNIHRIDIVLGYSFEPRTDIRAAIVPALRDRESSISVSGRRARPSCAPNGMATGERVEEQQVTQIGRGTCIDMLQCTGPYRVEIQANLLPGNRGEVAFGDMRYFNSTSNTTSPGKLGPVGSLESWVTTASRSIPP